jgi:sterol desaturase/sphingolipid hydroxylase (fatty acid hydroxylase superfamily)
MKKELVFVMIAAVCVFAIAVFMIGGVLQDVDYHDLSKLPLLEQKAAYDKMQTRRTVGEVMQLIGAILALTGFITVTVVSLSISHYNAKEAEKKYVKE